MKIWILTSETPFFNPGGIARYVDNFARYMGQVGHEVIVISRGACPEDREIAPGYHYYSFVTRDSFANEPGNGPSPDAHPSYPYNIMDYWTALSFQFADEVESLVPRFGLPDVIEAQEYNAIAYYLIQRRLTEKSVFSNVPVVIHTHSPDFLLRRYNEEPRYQLPAYWNGRMELSCMYAADAVLSPSRYLADQLEGILDDPRIAITDIPLPWTDVSRIQYNGEISSGEVVYLGRLELRKGVREMLAGCEQLWNEGSNFRLTLIGGDTQYVPRGCSVRTYLEKRYKHRIEDGKLKLLGHLQQSEVLQLTQRAEVVVIPSVWENWPNTCIEAMSLGKVVVASRHGGQAAMIGDDETAGFLFSWDEVGSFESQLKKALALESAERVKTGKAAHERIANLCHPNQVLPRRLEHFKEVIRNFSSPTRFPFTNAHLRDSNVRAELPQAENPGLVTAVVPFYNLGAFVYETIDSLRRSDYRDLEILIINDGSTDPVSLQALADLEKSGEPNLRIAHFPNAGLATARNRGAALARGQYLVFVDADDAIEPSFISQSVELIRKFENVFIVYCWERYFDANHDIYPCWNFEFPYLLAHNMTAPLCVVDRLAFLKFGQNKPRMAYNFEDYEGWIAMVAAGCGGVSINRPLVRYRVRRDSLWQGSNRPQHLYLYDLLMEEHPDLYREYAMDLFGLQNANGPAQAFIKPAAWSPYDSHRDWTSKEIVKLQQHADQIMVDKEAFHDRLVAAEKALQQANLKAHQIWLEKNEFHDRLVAAEAELRNQKMAESTQSPKLAPLPTDSP